MKKITFFLTLLGFAFSFALTSCKNPESAQPSPTSKPNETISKPATENIYKDAFLVDVRTKEEFAEGSAQGAINIPLDEVEKNLAQFQGKEKIVVFCRSGNRSGQAKEILEKHNITNVTNGGTWEEVNAIVQGK